MYFKTLFFVVDIDLVKYECKLSYVEKMYGDMLLMKQLL